MSQIQRKNVLITGGASGIGKIMGRMMLERGAKLIIWDRNQEKIEETVAELALLGEVTTFQVDVSNLKQIKDTALLTKNTVGTIDILINNAGIVVGKYFHEHSLDDITNTMHINANAPMYIAHEFLQDMMNQNSGHICNIASLAGLISNPRMSVYASSKWAVIGWSDSLRLEMEKLKKNVHVTTVGPYYMSTGMFAGVKSKIPILDPEKVAAKIIRAIEKDKILITMPFGYRAVRLLQGILSIRGFDRIVGKWAGIYTTMDEFTGHNTNPKA